MKICSYTMTSDTGFAPNPYHGRCTLAACTPNHMGAKLEKGDWIAGFFNDTRVPCLVYTMRIEEVMGYNKYYRDMRFEPKKPRLGGTREERCGDNIYHQDGHGKWLRDKGPFHQNNRLCEQDTRHAIVYIGNDYAYFGNHAYENPLPDEFRSVLKKGQGIKYVRDTEPLFGGYIEWLQTRPIGIHGSPRDGETIITNCSFNPKSKRGIARKRPCT